MKVTEVRTARSCSCASWLSHYRGRAKPGPILSSSSFLLFFSGESPRNFLILPPIQRSKNLGPAPSLQLRVIRQPYTLHHPARGGSSLMPSSHTDPEICARHNLGSSRPARRLPRCTLRRNLRNTAQPPKNENTSCFKSAWSAALTSGAIGNGKPNFSAMTRSTLASIALYSGSPAFTGLGRSAK